MLLRTILKKGGGKEEKGLFFFSTTKRNEIAERNTFKKNKKLSPLEKQRKIFAYSNLISRNQKLAKFSLFHLVITKKERKKNLFFLPLMKKKHV